MPGARAISSGVEQGFTLIELILVMAIAGILAAVAAPRMVDRSAFHIRGGASEVRTALRYAQQVAMAKDREVCVTRTPAPPSISLTFNGVADTGGPCDRAVVRPGGAGNYVVTMPAGIALASSAAVFRFDGQGRPITTPPATPVSTPVSYTVGGTTTISVQPETGYVQ